MLDIISRLYGNLDDFDRKRYKNHNKVIGLRQVIRCIKSNQLWCVLIATDIDEHIKQEILAQCTSYGIPYVIKFTRKN